MTARVRTSGLSHDEQHAARAQITERFTPGSSKLSAVDALTFVSMAAGGDPDMPEVTATDALDALALAGPARFHLEVAELQVMAYARHVLRVEWDRIGLRLGYLASGAKQGAQARYASLAKRYPWVVEEVRAKVTPALLPADGEGGQQ